MDLGRMNLTITLRAIASAINQLAKKEEERHINTNLDSYVKKPAPLSDYDSNFIVQFAENELYWRRVREHIISDQIFADAAWDILLDLYIQKSKNISISITSACIASMVPPTTALRWLTVLEEEGLISTENDEYDKRRRYVRLTNQAFEKITHYLSLQSDHQRRPAQWLDIVPIIERAFVEAPET